MSQQSLQKIPSLKSITAQTIERNQTLQPEKNKIPAQMVDKNVSSQEYTVQDKQTPTKLPDKQAP